MAVKFSQFDVADSQADISHLVGYKDTENVQITPAKINESNTLDSVTDNGATTTNNITANSFIKSGGTSTQFLKADGSVDSTDYQEQLTAGTGISIAADVVTNTAPDQTVTLTEGANVTITGTYPDFTIASADIVGAVDSVNGQTGVVVLDSDDIAEGATNEYLLADSVTYAKLSNEFTTSAALSTNVDFSTAQVFTKTLGSNTTLTFSNAEIGMVKDLVITGDYTLTLPAGSTVAGTYDGTVSNLIQVVVTGASEYWFSISQAQ